jgi:hypothetical protein
MPGSCLMPIVGTTGSGAIDMAQCRCARGAGLADRTRKAYCNWIQLDSERPPRIYVRPCDGPSLAPRPASERRGANGQRDLGPAVFLSRTCTGFKVGSMQPG